MKCIIGGTMQIMEFEYLDGLSISEGCQRLETEERIHAAMNNQIFLDKNGNKIKGTLAAVYHSPANLPNKEECYFALLGDDYITENNGMVNIRAIDLKRIW